MKIKTGGAAFPWGESDKTGEVGMSIRDFFAAKAMQGMISDMGATSKIFNAQGLGNVSVYTGISERAYAFADAMIRERDKDGTE